MTPPVLRTIYRKTCSCSSPSSSSSRCCFSCLATIYIPFLLLFLSGSLTIQTPMARSTFELDFFALENNSSSRPAVHPRSSIRGLQRSISKIDPTVLRSVIAAPPPSSSSCPLPVLCPVSRSSEEKEKEKPRGTIPLTIFYNGAVAVFDVTREKAETIIKMAEKGNVSWLMENGGLPGARRNSLHRFLEKRKERLTATAPYSTKLDLGTVNKVMGLEISTANY